MKVGLIILFFSCVTCSPGCFKKSDPPVPPYGTQIYNSIGDQTFPEQLLWSNHSGKNFLTLSRNQHIPTYCGSCWAFASLTAIADRLKIQRHRRWPDIVLSVQNLLSCDTSNDGCHGGDPMAAYRYIAKEGIPDNTCSQYQAKGHDDGLKCSNFIKCGNCDSNGKCYPMKKYKVWHVSSYGYVQGETQMIRALQDGPFVAGICVDAAFEDYSGGIWNKTSCTNANHAVEVVGYGVTSGVKYWLIRNSWGTYWGEQGFVKLHRGSNVMGIETTQNMWAQPDVKNRQNEIELEQHEFLQPKYEDFVLKDCDLESENIETHVISPLPQDTIASEELPNHWDWRNINGTNYLSLDKNQHIPHYCGSCWAFASTSALTDRFIIKYQGNYQFELAPQVAINCHTGGDCGGGDKFALYKFAMTHGFPDNTCQQYLAKNPKHESCSDIQQCMTCVPPPDSDSCSAVKDYKKYKVSEYGKVTGALNIKKEIYSRGPIACSMHVTSAFHEYSSGIFKDKTKYDDTNHVISLIGWGTEKGTEYWIGRNSWGTYWGEQGHFRIKMYNENLLIESNCMWGVPLMEES